MVTSRAAAIKTGFTCKKSQAVDLCGLCGSERRSIPRNYSLNYHGVTDGGRRPTCEQDWLSTGGYVDSCYHATARECGLTADECVLLARNSLEATFAAPEDKAALVERLRAYCEGFSA